MVALTLKNTCNVGSANSSSGITSHSSSSERCCKLQQVIGTGEKDSKGGFGGRSETEEAEGREE